MYIYFCYLCCISPQAVNGIKSLRFNLKILKITLECYSLPAPMQKNKFKKKLKMENEGAFELHGLLSDVIKTSGYNYLQDHMKNL